MTDHDREHLVRILGMLGSMHAGERAAAALQAEAFRKKHGLTWGELLQMRPAPPPPPPPPQWSEPPNPVWTPAPKPSLAWLYTKAFAYEFFVPYAAGVVAVTAMVTVCYGISLIFYLAGKIGLV